MSILDLQGLQAPVDKKGPPSGSRTSKGCGTTAESTLSLICNLL
jgi:Lanthionine-containing peptide SapB precursor RamS